MFSIPSSAASTVSRWLRAASLATLLAATPGAFAIDVNTATQEQLLTVRGIGPKTAQTIVQERERGGRYQSLEDLSERVKGIGSKKAAAMQAAGLTVEGAATTAPAAAAADVNAQSPADKPHAARKAH